MKINNHTFLIGGGASGLGFATAKLIVENGGSVILVDINKETGQTAETALGENALFVQTDVTNEESVQNAIRHGLEKFGKINGLVNCAGLGPAKRVLGRKGIHSLASFNQVIQVNLIGTFNLTSVAAFDGQIGQAAYSASKGGIVAMTLPIAREFARVGIRVMTIAPGIFETPMLANLSDEIKDSLGQQIPFPSRLGHPKEYATLALHIIENQMLNGEVIRLDGAIRMTAK